MNQLLPLPTPDVNSYSVIIRDGWLAKMKQVKTFQSVVKWASTKAKNIQPQSIPYAGVYIIEETLSPDGDPDAGCPKFIHALRMGFQIIVISNDPEAAEHNLDVAHWAIMNMLTDEHWHVFAMPAPFDPVRIEACTRGSRVHAFGNAGLNNDVPIAELRMDLSFTYRTLWPPVIPDSLQKIRETVYYPWPYDPEAHESTQIEVNYDFPID
jgi:hypothetical protein